MGTAFLYGNGGSDGTGATLTVTAPAGCTVTVSKDGKTKTKVVGADGVAVFRGLATGDWTINMTDGVQTAAPQTVTITADYETAITFFAATIHITYPAGSSCTATDGTTTITAPDTSGTWDCVVPNAGTWTIKFVDGETEFYSKDIDITENEQSANVAPVFLYRYGNECTAITGGWGAVAHNGQTNLHKASTYMNVTGISGQYVGIVSTSNKVSISRNTVYFDIRASGSNNVILRVENAKYGSSVVAELRPDIGTSRTVKALPTTLCTAYVTIYAEGSTTVTIYRVWME